MPTKFSEFFKLASDADGFQNRIHAVIKDEQTIMDCYGRIYDYIIGGLGWRSRMFRHYGMDDRVDITTGYNPGVPQQMEDSEEYFEDDDLGELENRVMFEHLTMSPQDRNRYGPNVFIQQFDNTNKLAAQTACRQVQLYSQIQIYNYEYQTQLQYSKDNHLQPPPNGEIQIDPTTAKGRVDPDNQDKKDELSKYVDDLVNWIKTNYPDVQSLLAKKTVSAFFQLIFLPGNYELTAQSVQTMLNSIRDLKDSRPRSVKKAFREWTIEQLKAQVTFWNNEKISNAYGSFLKLKGASNPKIYGFFMKLFSDFLSTNTYAGETDPSARRIEAIGYISNIFSNFSSADSGVTNTYNAMIMSALGKVQKAYPERYTSNLLQAGQAIPDNNKVKSILSEDLSYTIKEKADELLSTLPLLRGKNKVKFFVVQNFDDLKALNDGSVIVQNKNMSPVVVPGDPKENDVAVYRPIYRAGFTIGATTQRAIAFGNLPNFQGTFYYRNVESPAVMQAASKKGDLTIDFQNYTIEYQGMANKFTSDNGKPFKDGAKTVVFFAFLKNYTKWTEIKGGRRYDPYYATTPTSSVDEPHLTAYVAAARGAARALPLGNDELCLWFWNCPNQTNRGLYGRLGEVLGLPADRHITVNGSGGLTKLPDVNQKTQVQIGATQCKLVNYGARQFRAGGFHYPFIGITPPNNPEEFYVQVNTPGPSVADVLTANTTKGKSRELTNDPKGVLEVFNFSYYRRITSEPDPKTNLPDFTEDSKVIQLFGKNDKRKPSGGTLLPQWTTDSYDAFGVNLPICFNVKDNIIRYFLDKQNRGKIINKGNSLFREEKARKDAGTAMSGIYNYLKPDVAHKLSPKKVPATTFAKCAMEASQAVQSDWGKLKNSDSNYFPVNQEWCHLRGHGDGGDEYPGNFVSGSYHCNTEQLAIETGQRLVTQQMKERTFVLHTTAYLLRDATNYKSNVEANRKSQILTSNYLKNQATYNEMLENNIARRSAELPMGSGPPAKKSKGGIKPLKQGAVAPLAAYLRYKVMNCQFTGMGGSKRTRDQEKLTKFFDFIFEGQSEFVDKNQFTIISQAIQFALSADKLKIWYDQSVAELDNQGTT